MKKRVIEIAVKVIVAALTAFLTAITTCMERYESFLTEKEIIDDEAEEKLCWLRGKIDWLDPFIEYDDELLTENDKKELICPKSDEIQHRTTWQSFFIDVSRVYFLE